MSLTGSDFRPDRFVLASASRARQAMLTSVGLPVLCEAAHIDEGEIKESHKAAGTAVEDVAMILAELKARRISPRHHDAFVLGADQMLLFEGRWFDKPEDRDAAKAQLQALQGKSHILISAACIVKDGERLWHCLDRAKLTMRPLSESFIDSYLEAAGEAACQSVGAYQLEGLGAQLFSKIEGDFFTILGLPLLPLLDYLRLYRLLPA